MYGLRLACDIYFLVINSLLKSLNFGGFIGQGRQHKTLNRNIVQITLGRSGWLIWGVAGEGLKSIFKVDKMVRGVY